MTVATSITVRVPLTIRRRPGRKTVVTPVRNSGDTVLATRADPALVKALARAFRYQRMLDEGRYASITEMAAAEKIDRGYLGPDAPPRAACAGGYRGRPGGAAATRIESTTPYGCGDRALGRSGAVGAAICYCRIESTKAEPQRGLNACWLADLAFLFHIRYIVKEKWRWPAACRSCAR